MLNKKLLSLLALLTASVALPGCGKKKCEDKKQERRDKKGMKKKKGKKKKRKSKKDRKKDRNNEYEFRK